MKFLNLKLTTPYLEHEDIFYHEVELTPLDKPFLISASQDSAKLLGVEEDLLLDEKLVDIVNGAKNIKLSCSL